MRKPVSLGVLGLSIVVAGVSIGVVATRYLELQSYAPKAPMRALPPDAAQAVPADPPEKWNNLFAPSQGMKIPTRLAAPSGKSPVQEPRTNFVLIGTIVSSSRDSRRAILWADGMKEPKAFRERQEVEPGAVLSSVERDKVWISRGKVREKLDLLPVGSRTRPTFPAAPGAPQASAPRDPGVPPPAGELRVSRIAENRYAVDEAGVAQISGNFNQFMSQVRMIPYFEGNRSAGYRLAAIRPGSTFERLGFQGGDVLQQVNGLDLSSPEKLYTVFQNLKDEKKVSVNILRQGQKSTLTYEIR